MSEQKADKSEQKQKKAEDGKEKKRRKSGGEPTPAQEHPAQKVGDVLRQARLEKKMNLEEISAAINVRVVQLKAIEEGHIDQLPGMTYALGFVKSYATLLKLDSNDIANRFKAEHSATPVKPELHFREPIAESKMPDPMVIGAAALAVVVLLVVWAVFSGGDSSNVQAVNNIPPPPPADSAALLAPGTAIPGAGDTSALTSDVTAPPTAVPAPGSPIATGPLQNQVTPLSKVVGTTPDVASNAAATAAATPASTPASTPATGAAAPAATAPDAPDADNTANDATDAAPAVVVPPATPRPRIASQDDGTNIINVRRGRSRITLKANQSTWVQITDDAQTTVFKKVMRPGDEYFVPDQKGLSMVTSNAGGLEVYVDGKMVQSLGRAGEIIRGIDLDPAELKMKKVRTRY